MRGVDLGTLEVRGCRGTLRESCQPFRDYYTESRKQQASHPHPWLDTRGIGRTGAGRRGVVRDCPHRLRL